MSRLQSEQKDICARNVALLPCVVVALRTAAFSTEIFDYRALMAAVRDPVA